MFGRRMLLVEVGDHVKPGEVVAHVTLGVSQRRNKIPGLVLVRIAIWLAKQGLEQEKTDFSCESREWGREG